MKRLFFITLVCSSLLLLCQPVHAEDNADADAEKFVLEIMYGQYFKPVNVIVPVGLNITTKTTVLQDDDLRDFASLKLKNNFKDLYDPNPKWYETKREDYLIVQINVFTVGTDYPIAFNVEVKFAVKGNSNVWEDQMLGYCNIDALLQNVKDSITRLIEAGAINFYKSRGEL